MKKYFGKLISIPLFFALVACGNRDGFVGNERPLVAVPPATNVIPTAPTPSPDSNPSKANELLRRSGKIKAKDLTGKWENGQFKLEGTVEVLGAPSKKVILSGEVEDGSADLRPTEQSKEKSLRAKAYCYSGDEPCTEFFVDLFVMDDKQMIYHDQYVVLSPKSFAPSTTTTTMKKPTPGVTQSTEVEIEDDEDGEDDGFVGADEETAKQLFLPPPAKVTTPAVKPATSKNQAVDYCSAGRLQNATDFKKLAQDSAAPFKIYIPGRENAYGTQQLANVILELGKKVNTLMPGNKLAVGAISSKNGGKQKGHKSHQNGTDADISYLVNNSQLEFTGITSKDGVQSALLTAENWKLFKYAFTTGKVEMIFTDARIKKALCQEAIAKGDLKDAQDRGPTHNILSLIRVIAGHHDHFHLRVKCGQDNPLCKTKKYRSMDSGCFESAK